MMLPGRNADQRIMQQHQILAVIALLVLPFGLTQKTDEPYIVEPTPALRLGDEELTTVLLVSNDNRTASHGRYLNVRPNVGLLTSTARTFIQEGVTTEYATQVLGTTLENGRIYAQLLKKSSRVLFDKESVIAPSAPNNNNGGVVHTSIIGEEPAHHQVLYPQPRSLLQSHNDLVADKDWQDIDDRIILEKNSFVGNTDFVGSLPKRSHIVFPVKTASQDKNEHVEQQFKQNLRLENLPLPGDSIKPNDDAVRIMANKVQPAIDLPTYTIKNMFSPSGFSWEPSSEAEQTNQQNFDTISTNISAFSVQRSPKLLYHQVMKDEHSRVLSTVTYYGFADFTTIVGDSVIVFSPSTSAEKMPSAQVTSIKGKATLGPQEASHFSQVSITITQDLIEPTFVIPMLSTEVNDLRIMPIEMREKNRDEQIEKKQEADQEEEEEERYVEPQQNNEEVRNKASIANVSVNQQQQQPVLVTFGDDSSFYDEIKEIEKQSNQKQTTLSPENDKNTMTTNDENDQTTEINLDDYQVEHFDLVSSVADLSSSMTDSSIPTPTQTTSRVMLSRPSDEEILKIYSSLARAEAELAAQKTISDISTTINNFESMTSVETTTENTPQIIVTNENPLEKITTTPSTSTTVEDDDQIQPDVHIEEGATTIFSEDDPFLEFVSPSSTSKTVIVQKTKSVETTPESVNDSSKVMDDITEPAITDSVTVIEEDTTVIASTDSNSNSENENNDQEDFKPIIKEIEENEEVQNCVRTSQVYLTQIPTTLTYYTTFFIPNDDKNAETSTSIETNTVSSFDIAQATKHYCIQSTRATYVDQTINSVPAVLERPIESTSNIDEHTNSVQQVTTPMMIVRENAEVTEAITGSSGDGDSDDDGYEDETEKNEENEDDSDDQESGEEVELIYKTLYTTYTYLTTFFHDSTTSVSSHKEIVTNIVTSSMSLESITSTEYEEIEPTSTESIQANLATPILNDKQLRSNTKFDLQSSDLIKIDGILREDSHQPNKLTAQLDDSKIAKTYFTTYTYYTTIFVDGETEIMSRTEVHTNIVGKSQADATIIPSARNLQIDDTVLDEENAVIDLRPTPTYDTIQRTATLLNEETKHNESQVQELESSSSSSSSRSEKKIVAIIDLKSKSSSSITWDGQNQIIENGVLEDQISSESNTEEIIPSATLLLQTSFTTFTYYTTMYSNEATNVVSRLETITNIVTETLQPTNTVSLDEATLPITYFTTFTYWTKLAKEGEITTLSREETISNIVMPSVSELIDSNLKSISSVEPVLMTIMPLPNGETQSSLSELSKDIEPTTYYTTYTYYTTSYAGDQTVTDSRFETVTSVLTPSNIASSLSTQPPPAVDSNTQLSNKETDQTEIVDPPRTISFDFKTIVDAEGISTLYFKTEVIATVVDGTPTEIASSSSTINIDEVKKALSTKAPSEGSDSGSTRTYKTGLVRLIEGTKLSNQTTTVYQSKVIGTIIDQRYAQIIESTSSFIIEKTTAPGLAIEASSTLKPTLVQPTILITADKTLESSISDAQDENNNQNNEGGDEGDDANQNEDENEDGDDDDDESGRPRTRLSFQTKKKTFTPVIRPFVSRNRPQFAPKRKNILQSSATIITRSDLTPTITATPAIKSDGRGRFSSSRKSNVGIPNSGIGGSSSQGGKRFGRPSKSSQFGAFGSSSSYPGSSSRNRLQSSRGGVQQGFSSSYNGGGGFPNSRRSGGSFRGSSTSTRSFSSAYPGNSRLRIRPSSSLPYDSLSSTASYTTLPADSAEDDGGVTQRYESDEEPDFTTENLRRNNNNLLRLRRPQLNRPAFQVTPRRNPLNPKPRTTTSTSTTTQRPRSRAGQRPSSFGQIQNRSRPQNSLFPPRRLFQAQNANQGIDEAQKPGTGEDFENEKDDIDSSDYENEDEGIEDEEQDDVSRRRRSESISRSLLKKRSKRQANNFRNRFRRPSTAKPVSEERGEDPIEDESSSTVRSRASSRFTPRTHSPAHTPSHSTSSNKAQHNNRAIRPTKPNSNNRAQFTLREKDTTPKHSSPRLATNFRRPLPNGGSPSSSSSSRRTTTAASRPKAPRIKNFGNPITETTHSSSPRGRTPSSRSRSTARSRSRSDFTTDPIVPAFDGTITVTHTTPTEITIPIVNGKVTEYKNVLTTTTSTEVVPPNQYTSLIGQLGSSTLVLNREETSVNLNGATEVTQFILHEQPTTTVIFTPTTIRGRKTSFAHMIPSTAYLVENVVSTMQPQIAANAPLANILLSQLLLGNLGSLNQPNINPLLALGGATQANSQIPGVPTTEYKTSTSTFVTTVTNGMSTIIPLTFHGKEILTTIYDSSSAVITATEYFTETIVITPTQQAQQVQQVNSLLLPYLLQQQLQGQGQQQPSQPALPIQNSIPPQLLFPDNLQDLDHNGIQKYNDYSSDIEDYPNNSHDEQIVESSQNINTNTHNGQRSGSRKKGGRKFHKQHASAPAPAVLESSVITLYVSGRRPGEFSTVLSTVQKGAEPSLRKRQINRAQPLFRSTSPDDTEDYYSSDGSEIEEYLLPASKDITSSHNLKSNFLSEETQSLESIVGDVGLWYTKTSALFINDSNKEPVINTNNNQHQDQNTHNSIFDIQNENPSTQFLTISKSSDESTSIDNGRFFHFESFDIRPHINSESLDYAGVDDGDAAADDADDHDNKEATYTGVGNDKARYNLATRVMSNGVEVIIAGDKNGKLSAKPNVLRILPSLSRKPMTLAPSTLKDQMILVMPSNAQETYTIPIDSKHFITKTCLTTYTYRTTYLQDGKTTVESREKVVSNTATEERNYLKIKPTETLGITLSRTPELAVGVFHTTYTYYNTILNGELSIVVSSQHVLTNTITGPDDYISFLQPSEQATPVLETNTYFSKISLTKTLKESDLEKIVSTSNILTQVIVTESLQPPQSSSIITSYVAFDIDETTIKDNSANSGSSLKPYNQLFQTYSYYTVDEKVENKKPDIQNAMIPEYEKIETSTTSTTSTSSASLALELAGSLQTDLHIYATKTYLTTFTYFTTLMNTNEKDNIDSSTVVSFHTRVIENVITESIPSFIINTDLLSAFETQLKNPLNHNSFVTMVTLSGGQSLEITAMNMLHPSLSYKKNHVTKSDTNNTKAELSSISTDTQLPFENSNEIFDSDVASSENEEILAEQYLTAVEADTRPIVRNNTKTAGATTDFPSVNQLIGSFSLNRLQALGPVFNAMAGLIQNNLNNFGTNPNSNSNSNYELKKNSSVLSLEGKQAVKNISAYSSNGGSFEHSHEGPIYIPVQSLPNENSYLSPDKIKISGPHQNLHISPPETSNWFIDSKLNRVKLESGPGPSLGGISKPKYETPLLNGGIPISPGEVITANSDVIVGKPNGIQPRVPYNNKVSDVVNPLVPPPSIPPMTPYSYQFQYQKHVKASPSPIPLSESSSLNFDGILKPPSMKPQSMQHQHQHQHQNKKLIPPHGLKNANYRAHYATSHMHQPSQHYAQQSQQQRIPMPHHLPQNNQVQWLLNAQRPKPMPNYIPYTPYDYDQQHPPSRDKNNDRHASNLSNLNNEILEIKRIPEVYSTDLPASETTLNNSSQSKNPTGIYKAFVKRIINSDKPMLVDIQPSKITNIVIPRDNSASILVVESSVELHKNGQYYDEPTTYSDAFMTGSVAISPTSANQPRKPILSNQQINLDTNVLSHNVDINVPPITFKKDAEFPHSTPVRGHIQKNEQFTPFKMPHVTIPLTDNQIQVNLTPQNVITQNMSSGHFVNDVHSIFNNKANIDNLKPELGMKKTTQSQLFYDNQINNQPEQRPVLEHLKPLESSYFDGINAQIKPNSASFQHFNKTYYPSYPNVIPLRSNIEFSNSSKKSPIQRPVQLLKPQKYQETLQIFAKVNPTPIQLSQSTSNKEEFNFQSHRPPPPTVSDHVPLVNLFYESSNDGNKYFSNSDYFSDKIPPPTSSHSHHHHHHNYPIDSNPVDDQKPSSSLNIGVPVSQREENLNSDNNDRDEDYKMLESQIKQTTPTTESTIIQPAITNKFIPNQPSPSTINQMDDLYIKNQLSPPSVQNFTALLEQPSPGRPFTQLPSRISTKMPNLTSSTNIPRVVFNSGQGFKLQHVQDQTQNEFFQQTHPVDSVTDDSDSKQYKNKKINSSHQTEAPFNPKYTKRTKKPQRTAISMSSATASDSPTTTTQLLNLNQMEVLNKPSTVNEPISNNGNISFNHHRESSEIFDFHESINPHNYKFIHTNEATPTTKTSKEQLNLYSSTDTMMTHQRPTSKNTKTRYQLVSEPSTDMKPPSPSPELSSIKPQTERVLGLNPPPPPPPPSPKISVPLLAQIPIASFSPSASVNNFDSNYSQLSETTFQSPVVIPQVHTTTTTTTINPLKKPNRPINTSPFAKYNYNTSRPDMKLKSKPKTNSKPNYTTAKTTKPPTRAQNDNSSSPAVPTTTKSTSLSPIIPQSTTPIAESVSSFTSAPSSSFSLSKKDGKLKVISPTVKEVVEKSSSNVEKSVSSQDSSMILLSHEIPEEILIEGSEKHHHRQSQFTNSRFIENQTETRTKPFSILIGKEVIPIENYQNHSKFTQIQASGSEFGSDLNHFNSRTKARTRTRTSGPHIVPTKYITKPHYLTVTTTKLSISTSLGVPVTHSLTLTPTETKTSTLVDTVTETHTLLQPTRVTESHTTTATQIIHYDDYHQHNHHHQYRLGSKIKPTIEVVNNVLLTSSELSESETVPSQIPVVVASTLSSVSTSTRTVEALSNTNSNSNTTTEDLENNSIFVVMTDKNSQGGVFSIGPSMMDTPQNINAIGVGGERAEVPFIPEIPSSNELDYDYNITFDYLPTRDEEAETNEVNHVLLGGVLIATPPKSSDNNDGLATSSATCRPSCKASRNELCQQIDNRMQCLCRPGFARMFPDRPCRPTYTYALEIPIHRINSQVLHFNNQFRIRDSDDFKQLADITHNAVDRMVMQSDLRDVYHGVHVTSFDVADSPDSESGILGKFLIQLSDNSDEKRLVDVFKKYLRQNGFSLGGTEIFTTKDGINSLQVNDFNECAHSQFHDCSENSRCFNLQGTYTCSCQEGFADLSENSIYPGRICSAEVIGCEKCHFHGKCVQTNKTNQPLVTVCECFSWYTGASCQLNLKIVLIALMTIGTILFILLLFCVLVTCTRRRDNHSMPSFMSGMQIIAPKNTGSSAKNLTIDKRAMIKDSSSECSHNSLPYVLKKDVEKHSVVRNTNHHMQTQHQYQHQKQKPTKIINQRGHPSSALLISSFSEIDHQRNNFPEQNDRSLTVMIPRAKYHHSVLAQTLNPSSDGLDMAAHSNENQLKIVPSDTSGSSSNASTFQCSNEKKMSNNNSAKHSATVDADIVGGISLNHGALLTKSTGALVSAGFEVSATVGSIQQQSAGLTANMSSRDNRGGSQSMNSAPEIDFHKFNYNDAHLQYNNYKDGDKFIDSMDVWIDTIQQNELAAEARSFNETTIQAPTKALRCVYERQLSQSNGNDEANTMAERDIGSTCLLPHTHLYKPDRDSDVSGFDSF